MLVDLGSSSKLNAEWPFLSMLRDEERRAGGRASCRRMARLSGGAPTSTLTLAARENLDPEEAELELLGEKQPSLEFITPEQLGALAAFLCPDAAAQLSPNFAVKSTQVIEITGIGLSGLSTRRPNQFPSDQALCVAVRWVWSSRC